MSSNIDVSHPWFLNVEFILKKKKKKKKIEESDGKGKRL